MNLGVAIAIAGVDILGRVYDINSNGNNVSVVGNVGTIWVALLLGTKPLENYADFALASDSTNVRFAFSVGSCEVNSRGDL